MNRATQPARPGRLGGSARWLGAILAGTVALAGRAEKIDLTGKPRHHTPTGFRKPQGSPRPAHRPTFGERMAFLWRRIVLPDRPEAVPEGHVLGRQAALAGLAENGSRESVTWLGHASFLIRVAGKAILTDPYLTEYASPLGSLGPCRLVPPGLAIADLPPIDVLIVSHNHYDHLDGATIEALPGKQRMVVLAPLRLGAFFRQRGYADVRELDWHQRVDLDDVAVTALPAVHWSRRGFRDINRTLWMGAMIESPRNRVYFSGDTGYGPLFAELGARYGPFDVALVPIGGYLPASIMQSNHVNPEEAVRLGLDLSAGVLIAHHWGTVILTDEPPFEPPQHFRAAGRAAGLDEQRLWVMAIGETRPLPGRRPAAAGLKRPSGRR